MRSADVEGITDLDSIPHGLIPKRFLDAERVSIPDVDIDFEARRRVEAIRDVTEKYSAKIALIGASGTIKAENAIKESRHAVRGPAEIPGGTPKLLCDLDTARA